jgi:glycosyltransferase involved in cell wall biosynthesis
MDRDDIRVSIIIPTYNSAATLARALDSALAQRFDGAAEVVVVDDGSTDSTPAVLSAYASHIKTVRQRNRGVTAARNAAVAAACGIYVAFLDADDVWMPDRLAKTVALLDADEEVALAYSDVVPVDQKGEQLAAGFVNADAAHAPSMEELLNRWWPILPSAVTMRRDVYNNCGGFDERFKGAGGFAEYLWIRARESGRYCYVPEPLVIYCLTPFVERMHKYASGYKVYQQLLSQRYGLVGQQHIRRNAQLYAWLLTLRGIRCLAERDIAGARRAALCALRYWPDADARRLALAAKLPRPNAQGMIALVLRNPRTGLDRSILCGSIPVDLR